MAQTKLGERTVNTLGDLPMIGSTAPDFTLVGNDLKQVALSTFAGKNVVLNIFPSVDTSTCAASVREFNKRAASLTDTVVLCISKDLPFAMRRFCGAEGIDRVKLAIGVALDELGVRDAPLEFQRGQHLFVQIL